MNTSNKMITILAVVAGSIISVALVSAAIISSGGANKGNTRIVDFQVYWDRSCTNRTSAINWGTMEPSTTESLTVYIKNTGTIPERLNMRTSKWNPTTAQKYLTLTWDCENSILNRASNTTATFTLRVSSNVPNLATFSFDITITGTQTKS